MTTKGTAALPTARRGSPSSLFDLLNGLKASFTVTKYHVEKRIIKEAPRRKK
jgi:hypothetical protein